MQLLFDKLPDVDKYKTKPAKVGRPTVSIGTFEVKKLVICFWTCMTGVKTTFSSIDTIWAVAGI